MEGLLVKKNKSGHTIARLHYSADPDKNPSTPVGKKWIEEEEAKYQEGRNDIKWRQEMEIDFDAGVGELVFPWFMEREESFLVAPHKLDEGWTLYGGFDWGVRNPTCSLVIAVDKDQNVEVIWESYTVGLTIREVAQRIREFDGYNIVQWISADPTIFNETVAREDGFTSIAAMFMDKEIVGPNTIEKFIPAHNRSDGDFITLFKNMQLGEVPKIKFWRGLATESLRQELRNLKHPKDVHKGNPAEKILDLNNHAWDAFKYAMLSNPIGYTANRKLKFGTYEYVNKATEISQIRATLFGTDVQAEFNDIYGKELTEETL